MSARPGHKDGMTNSRDKSFESGAADSRPRRIRILVLCGLIGMLVGSGGWTFHTAKGTSYFSNDPNACLNCHIMREPFAGWQKSSHHAVAACNDCHVSAHPVGKWLTKADNGFRHSWSFTFQDFHEPIQLHPRGERVLHENCLRCHRATVAEITAHTEAVQDVGSCVRCHDSVGHAARR